jgi:hypothetical protein
VFKIRKPDAETWSAHEKAHSLYLKHLATFNNRSNGDLWKFFGCDFFHDGEIRGLSFSVNLSELRLSLDCPNIKRRKDTGDYEYLSAGFECLFRGVQIFRLHEDKPEAECYDGPSEGMKFRYAEINTSVLDGRDEQATNPVSSLMIETVSGDRTVWVEIIFAQVDVTPDEPLVFALMETDERYELPSYGG